MELFLHANDGRVFRVVGPARVGREAVCEIALNDPKVSRVHATVWVDGARLGLRDEGSSNGTFVNGQQIQPGQVYGLQPGDQVRIGGTILVVEAAAAALATPPAPAGSWPAGATMPASPTVSAAIPQRRAPWPMLAVGGCAVLFVLVVCGGAALVAVQRPPLVQTALAQLAPGQQGTASPATVPPGEIKLTVLSTSAPPTPLPPEAFAANEQALPAAVAELNQAELDFVQRARAQAGGAGGRAGLSQPADPFVPISESDFNFLENKAIKVAVLAEQQANSLSAQEGGNSAAAQAIAETYATLAQQAFALTVKVDEMRQSWLAQTLGLDEAASRMATISSAIWNASVTAPGTEGNPFAAYAADPAAIANPAPLTPEDFTALLTDLNNPSSTLSWLALSPPAGEETITLPPAPAGEAVNPFDPALQASLIAASASNAPGQLAQIAGAMLAASAGLPPAGQPGTTPATVTIPKVAAVVAGPQTAGSGHAPPGFPNGQVTVISQDDNSDDLLGSLAGLDGNNTPTTQGQTPIEAQAPVVVLTINNLTIQAITKRSKDAFNTFEAEVQYSFDVQWTTTLAAPQFELDCVGGNHFAIAAASGSQHINAKGLLIIYPGREDAFCYASHGGNTWGSTSVHFLVGDAAEATQRAIQVETDSAALNLTLTADALATTGGAQTRAAQTQAVQQTADALSTEQAGTQRAEAGLTATYLAANEARFATETQAALSKDSDVDGVIDADDRCFDQVETRNGWRDDDGCPDTLPTMNIVQGAFVETLTNGPVDAFSSLADLVVNFAAGTTSGTLTGGATWEGSYFCYNTSDPSETFETVSATYKASYTADVSGTAKGDDRTFQGTLQAVGVTHITLSQQFTDERCTQLNSANLDDHWTGEGTVSGTWDGNTFGTLATDWKVDSVGVAGSWSGTVSLTE